MSFLNPTDIHDTNDINNERNVDSKDGRNNECHNVTHNMDSNSDNISCVTVTWRKQ